MVSNSGTMLSASASPRSRPDFLQQIADLEQVGLTDWHFEMT